MAENNWSPDEEFEGLTPEQIRDRIYETGPNWSEEQLDAVEDWLERRNVAGEFTDAYSMLDDVRNEAQGEEPPPDLEYPATQGLPEAVETDDQVYGDALAEAVDYAAEQFQEVAGTGKAPELVGIDRFIPEELSPAERQRFITEATNQGRESAVESVAGQAQEQGADEGEARQLAEGQIPSTELMGATEPDWLLQQNGGYLSPQQKRRYVDYWNDAYGTFFRDFDTDLAPILGRFDGSETEVQNFAAAVLADQEPLISSAITLPLVQGERKVSYTQEQMEQLRTMGFSNDAITRLVRLSAITSGEDAIRPGDVGDTLRVGPLAMLARYFGGGEEFARFNQTQQEMAALEQQLGLDPGDYNRMSQAERRAFRQRLEDSSYQSPTESRGTGRVGLVDRLESMGRSLGLREEHGVTPGIIAANNNFRRGMDMYRGDEFLSFVHAVDPALAQRVAGYGPDPENWDWRDNAAVFNIMERAGAAPDSTTGLRQLESAAGFFGYFNTGRGGGGGGGAGPVRRLVDPVAVKEQVQQLWSRMFLADVDDATVAAMTANLQKQLDEAPEGMSFDVSARIAAFLRGQDVYDELYRNKPAGMAEEEYQSQFAAGVGDMLGNELDPEALKAGMRSGEYNTAVGRAASTKKLLTNSTLRGRWAQAKQTLDQFT
jgi:hypothetical protein